MFSVCHLYVKIHCESPRQTVKCCAAFPYLAGPKHNVLPCSKADIRPHIICFSFIVIKQNTTVKSSCLCLLSIGAFILAMNDTILENPKVD